MRPVPEGRECLVSIRHGGCVFVLANSWPRSWLCRWCSVGHECAVDHGDGEVIRGTCFTRLPEHVCRRLTTLCLHIANANMTRIPTNANGKRPTTFYGSQTFSLITLSLNAATL